MDSKEDALITVIGSINADLVAGVEQLPLRAETIHALHFQQHLGGKGANQAVAAALLGGRVAMVGCVGDDGAGAQALQGLAEAGVHRDGVRTVVGKPTGTALITVDKRGDNTIVVVPGANDALTVADVQAIEPQLAASAAVMLQLEVPDEVVLATTEIVAKLWSGTPDGKEGTGPSTEGPSDAAPHGGPGTGRPWLVLNPSPFRESALPPAGFIDLLLVNELEAEAMSGVPVSNPQDAAVAAEKLLPTLRPGGCVVITLGGQGALALADPTGPFGFRVRDGEAQVEVRGPADASETGRVLGPQPLYIPALKVDVVDTTGAGDVFTGGLVSQLGVNRPLPWALRFATAAAAITVTRPGAQSSFPRLGEVERLLARVSDVQVLTG